MAKTTTPIAPGDYQPPGSMQPEQRALQALQNYRQYNDKCQAIGKPFADLAQEIVDQLPAHGARTEALRKLLQARDIAFQAIT